MSYLERYFFSKNHIYKYQFNFLQFFERTNIILGVYFHLIIYFKISHNIKRNGGIVFKNIL